MSDFTVQNHGSIFILEPNTDEAREWCDEHLPEDVIGWGAGYAVEHRYIRPIVVGIQRDGLTVGG